MADGRGTRRLLRAVGALTVAASLAMPATAGATPVDNDPGTVITVDPTVADRLDSAISEAMAATSVPGAIVGLWGPDGDYIRTFGVADKATGAPMQANFHHRIGSVTKTFTVTAILQLVDAGRIGLDDTIGTYIEGVPSGDVITLRQLARMQSGLANFSANPAFGEALAADPYRHFSPQELLGYAFSQPMVFAPGEGFLYCNTNTVLLGLLVEKLSGQPLGDYIRDHITTPLGLADTFFPTNNFFPEPHAQGYTDVTADGSVAVATDWDPSWAWAAGAMISTLPDMRAWAEALATGTLLSPATQAQRLQTVEAAGKPSQDGYGVGLFNVGGWIGHNGSLPGYQTVVVHLPDEQRTLVIFTNTDISADGGEPSTALAEAITSIISPDHVYTFG